MVGPIMKHFALCLWFLFLTALNSLNWKIVPCEWSRPYGS
jgi:hypothetical protein